MEACESPRDQWQRLRQALRTATHQPNADRLQTIALVMEMVRSDELGPVQKECVQLARRLARQLGERRPAWLDKFLVRAWIDEH